MKEKKVIKIRLISLLFILLIIFGVLYFSIDNIRKNVGEENKTTYSVIEIDSLKVQEMYQIVSLSKPALESPFYNTTTSLMSNSFSDSQKLLIAYYLQVDPNTDIKQEEDKSIITEQVMDTAIKEIFGKGIVYQKTNFNPVFDNPYIYIPERNAYIKQNGYAYSRRY